MVPTYRPPREVADLISSLAGRTPVLVVDDASPCTSDDILRSLARIPNVRVMRFARNAGIARGLNVGLRFAREADVGWLLALDQDSTIAPGYPGLALNVANAALLSGLSVGAVGAGIIEDASGAIRYPTFTVNSGTASFAATHEVIQSGTLWNVAAVSGFCGFREDLGMDAGDAAACLALRQRGFKVLVDSQLTMRHRLGEAHLIRLFGHSVIRTGHGPQRRKAIVRNRLRLFPAEFRESPVHALRTVRRAAVNQVLSTLP